MGLHTIYRLEIVRGVVVPNHFPVRCRVRAQMAVHCSGENSSVDECCWSHLSGTAALRALTGGLDRRGGPNSFSRRNFQREQTASAGWKQNVGQGCIYDVVVSREAP